MMNEIIKDRMMREILPMKKLARRREKKRNKACVPCKYKCLSIKHSLEELWCTNQFLIHCI